MTAEAKVPHEGSDWLAVDIFVFTNGQQHSPPRKYHLTAQELNWWNNVLRFLARSQYGSLNSTVDLYTVEGQKVDGPLELINRAAYVAVKPPDNFIDTGYSKYLLKASRSWEKSQARRSISIEIIKPENGSALIAQSNLNIPVSKKIFKDEIVDEIIIDPITSDNKVIERPHACLNVHENPHRDSIVVLKKLEKKRISPVQRSSILRKSTTSTASVNKRDSLRSKDVITRNSKGPIRINEKIVGNNHSRNANKSKIPLKVAVPNSEAKSETDQNEDKDLPLTLNNTNPILIDGTELENRNEKQDQPPEFHIFKSVDSEIPSTTVHMCGNIFNDDDMNAQDANNKLNKITEECETKASFDAGKTVKNADMIGNTTITPNLDKEFIDQEVINASPIQKAPNASFRENTDNKFVVINNGDIVNLKLHIEVRNGDTATSKRSKPDHHKSSTDIPKTEKASQINVDTELAVQNKSLQSIYQSDCVGAHRNSAFVIVKCPCCPEKNLNMSAIDTENSTNHDKTYVILFPELEKIPKRCQCHKIEETGKENSPYYIQSIFNPVKKSKSAMALEILNPTLDISEITISSVRTTLPNIDGNAITSRNIEYVKIANESRHRVAIFDKEVTAMKYTDKDCSKNDCNEHNQCATSGNVAEVLAEMTGCLDKSTQTGVCSLLVEARIHDDGRYSFHLPPLEVLKYYKF